MREQIRQAYEDALKNPQLAGSNGRLGMLLYAYEQFESAAACFERARAFDPNDNRWAYYLGRVQQTLGKYDQAAASLREALRQNPEYLPAQLMLGECLLAAGRLDEGQKICEAVVQKHPDAAAAYYWLGKVQAARRELGSAVELFSKACDLYPSFGAAHYALAASPARYAVERGDWGAASELPVRPSSFNYVMAISHFARALRSTSLSIKKTS